MKKVLLVFAAIAFSMSAMAQTHDLSQGDIQAFKDRIGEMIDMFQNNLSILGSKTQPLKVKQVYKRNVFRLFIGEGEAYKDEKGQQHSAVTTQVSSIKNGQTQKRVITLKQYLNNLVNLGYAKVEITNAETYRISNIYKVGDHYEATATIFQKFCGYNGDGQKIYCDTTTKNMRIYIIPESDAVLGKHWSVKLGNIEVIETLE